MPMRGPDGRFLPRGSTPGEVGPAAIGDGAQKAKEDVDKLADALKDLDGAAAKVKPPALVNEGQRLKMIEKDAAKAAKEIEKLAKAYEKLRAASAKSKGEDGTDWSKYNKTPADLMPKATGQLSGAAKVMSAIFGGISATFGPKTAQGLQSSLAGAMDGWEKYGDVISAGGKALAIGGAAAAAGAVAVGLAVAKMMSITGDLLVKGMHLAIEESTKTEVQKAILDKITGGKGSAALDLATKIAMDIGIDDDKAIADVKRLLQAKFSQEEIPVLVKIAAGIDAVEGAGKGGEFLQKLENIKLKPKVTDKDIKGLAALGIDTKEVYAELAKKLGTDVNAAMAKVKAGLVDSKDVLDAIEKTASKSFGGVADKLGDSVPGLLMKIQVAFKDLFGNVDLGPLKGALKNVLDLLKSPAGEKLKESITRLFGVLGKTLFGPFTGDEGRKRLERIFSGIVRVIEMVTGAIETLAPWIEKAVDGFSKLFGQDTGKGAETASVLRGIVDQVVGLLTLDFDQVKRGVDEMLIGLGLLPDSMLQAGTDAGNNMIAGLVGSLEGGAAWVADAAAGMIDKAINAAKAAAGIASPSKEFGWIGQMNVAGMVGPMNDTGKVEQAGAKMADAAIAGAHGPTARGLAAQGADGGASGAVGGDPGGRGGTVVNVNFAPQIMGGGGPGGEASIRKMLVEQYPEFRAMARRAIREAAEGGRP